MSKLWAVARREYVQRVRSTAFLISTLLAPLLLAAAFVVPLLIAFFQAGSAPRLAVLDETGKLYEPVREAIIERRGWAEEGAESSATGGAEGGAREQNGAPAFDMVERAEDAGRPAEEVKRELRARVLKGQLDAFIVIPADVLTTGRIEYYGRNVSDIIANERLDDYLSRAVIERRVAEESGVGPERLRELTRRVTTSRVKLSEGGEEQAGGAAFYEALGVGLVLFVSLTSYGGAIMTAIVEEKQTRLVEVLFSSARPFTLMLGKLLGVSLVALTQYALWGAALGLFALGGGQWTGLPRVPLSLVACMFAFFLVGYFVYASVYALIGATTSTQDEGSSLGLFATAPLVLSYALAMPVMRAPNSWLGVAGSMIPFLSPVLMPVRFTAQTPPAWQIALSLLLAAGTALLLVWLAARVYRVGMLMYGKRPTIPEVLKWIRQA